MKIGTNLQFEKQIGYKKSLTLAAQAGFKYLDFDLTGNITPIKLTLEGLVAMDKVYDGTTYVTFNNGGELKGVIQGDLVSVGVINASFVDANKGENKRVIVKSVSLVGADSANYQVEATEVYATIYGKKTGAVHGSN